MRPDPVNRRRRAHDPPPRRRFPSRPARSPASRAARGTATRSRERSRMQSPRPPRACSRRRAVAREVHGDTRDQQAVGAPRAVLGFELVRGVGGASHTADVPPDRKRVEHGLTGRKRARFGARGGRAAGGTGSQAVVARLVDRAGYQPAVRRGQRQRRRSGDLIGAKRTKPLLYDLVASARDVPEDVAPQQIACARSVAGRNRMADRAVDVAVALEPVARPVVERGLQLRLGAPQL